MIPGVTVPLSLIGTFAAIYELGYSLDNLSLMALTIAVGFVVDDAVVVIENIVRHLEEGLSPYDAAMKGVRRDRLHRRGDHAGLAVCASCGAGMTRTGTRRRDQWYSQPLHDPPHTSPR